MGTGNKGKQVRKGSRKKEEKVGNRAGGKGSRREGDQVGKGAGEKGSR
jgi:hypothetical protein